MTKASRNIVRLCLTIAFLIPAAACSGTIDGHALPVTVTDVFGGLSACVALDIALVGQDFTQAVKDTASGGNGCKATKTQYGALSLALQSDLGIDDLNADKRRQYRGDVNGRRAIQIREGLGLEGGCAVAIEVTQKSRALLTAAATGTTQEACAFVYEVAQKVEPQLPKGS